MDFEVLYDTWKPKKGPIKTTVPLKGGYMGFHVRLGESMGSHTTPTVQFPF